MAATNDDLGTVVGANNLIRYGLGADLTPSAGVITVTDSLHFLDGSGSVTTINISGGNPTTPVHVTFIRKTGSTVTFASGGNISGVIPTLADGIPIIAEWTGSAWYCYSTLALSSLGTQTANTVLAAPDGSNGTPSFRALSISDIASVLPFKVVATYAELTAALTALSSTGGAILCKPGSYTMTASITGSSNVSIIAPWGGVTFAPNGNRKMFDLTSKSRVTFRGIKFDMTGFATNASYAIYADSVTDLTIEQCEFVSGRRAVELRSYTNVKVRDCIGRNASEWAFYFGGGTGLWVSGNKCYSNGLDGIKVGTANTTRTGTITVTNGSTAVTGSSTLFTSEISAGYYILDNSGVSATVQSVTNDTALVLTGNWSGTTQAGIAFYADAQVTNADVFITGNECYSNTGGGINVDSSSLTNCIVSDNVCRANTGYGITVKQVYEGGTFKDIVVSGNTVTANTGGGITVQRNDTADATYTNLKIDGNQIRTTDTEAGIRMQSVDSSVVTNNLIRGAVANSTAILLVDCDSNLIKGNQLYANKCVVLDNQASTHASSANVIEDNYMEYVTGSAGYGLVFFTDQNAGAWLANHSNNVVRHNRMKVDSFSIISTSTTGTKAYQNTVNSVTAIPTVYGHKGDVAWNESVDGLEKFGWVAVTTGNPAVWEPMGTKQLHYSVTASGTDADLLSKTLWTYTVPGGTLHTEGKTLRVRAWGQVDATVTTKTITFRVGGTAISSPTGSVTSDSWYFDATIIRAGSASQRVIVNGHLAGAVARGIVSTTHTMANDMTVSVTAVNGTAVANQITFTAALVEVL
jgi:hypothetical protein